MAKFCGKCGAKLEEITRECPNCDSYNRKQPIERVEKIKNDNDIIETTLNQRDFKKREEKNKQEKKIQRKIAKRKAHAQWSRGKKIRRFCLKMILSILFLMILAIGVTGGLVYFEVIDVPFLENLKQDKLLGYVNEKNIIVEEKNIDMTNETEGTATIVVKIPDYELLFKESLSSDNPERYLLKKLILKDYKVKEFEVSANITIENGEKMIHSEEAIHQVMEESLIDAIKALSEGE